VDLSQGLFSAFGTLENLNQATGTEMCQIKAIGAVKAAQIKAPLEVRKPMNLKPTGAKIKLKSIQAFVEKTFLFLKKSEIGNCKDCASGLQTTIH
jgi:DNA repair protein RadC